MSSGVHKEDWEALIGVLKEGIQELPGKGVETVKLKILEFSSTAAMLGLEDLAECGNRFEGFLLKTVAPDWNEEATATLSFAMGALVEKMEMMPYGPNFSSGLNEVLMYLDFYQEEGEGAAESEQAVEVASVLSRPTPIDEASQPQESPGFGLTPEELHGVKSPAVSPLFTSEEEEALLADVLPEPVSVEAVLEEPEALFAPQPVAASAPASIRPLESIATEADPNGEGYVVDRMEWYQELLREDPRSRLFTVLAEELSEKGLWQRVIKVCRQGLMYYPDNLRGRVLLGRALWETGQTAEAEEILTDAHRDLAANAVLYKLLAQCVDAGQDTLRSGKYLQMFQMLEEEGRKMASGRITWAPVTPASAAAPPVTVPENAPVGPAPEAVAEVGILPWLMRLRGLFEEKEAPEPVIARLFNDANRHLLKCLLHTSLS